MKKQLINLLSVLNEQLTEDAFNNEDISAAITQAKQAIERSQANNLRNTDTELIKEELKRRGFFALYWHVDDIKAQAQEMEIDLTGEQALKIAADIERSADASIGINWEIIEEHLHAHARA